MTKTVPALPFKEHLSTIAFNLPEGLTAEQWKETGIALERMGGSMQWWLGDWWAYGQHRYGDRKALVESDEWEGLDFQTCRNAAWVCGCFRMSRRRDILSFRHHAEVAAFCDRNPEIADRLLNWCEEPIAATGKPHTIRELREEVRKAKSLIAAGWTGDQFDRKDRALKDECVVANMREIDGRRRDDALLNWAEGENRMVCIDRSTEFGNPFEMPEDGSRIEVVAKFKNHYWPHKDGLLKRVPSLKGKVLVCWCYPEECHGDIIAETANRFYSFDNKLGVKSPTPQFIAEAIADHDG
jgi:hypothetical protein